MIVDQDEINALLAQAEGLAREAGRDSPEPAPRPVPPPPPPLRPPVDASPELTRTLKIRVPVIVQLASRRMSISAVRRLSLGTIIEFSKSVDEPLQLLINNRLAGTGDAVKVGEHFGLRVTQIRDAATRIKSMGK
jgi:flagellar motor switch protein FliN/FliY